MTDENNRQPESPQKPQRKIPRVEQAAILLMSLGENDAAEVLKIAKYDSADTIQGSWVADEDAEHPPGLPAYYYYYYYYY